MFGKKVRSQNTGPCLACPGHPQRAVVTTYTDGSYEWKCDLYPAHKGNGVWPVGSPAWEHATGK